ncbi:MAG: FlgD immunoglobulin-like domain containing protein [Bacteroidota bacterium]
MNMLNSLQETRISWYHVWPNRIARWCSFARMEYKIKGDPMVARLKDILPLCPTRQRVWARAGFLVCILLASLIGNAEAQDFHNAGTYKNSGKFRVRGQATGLPDTVGGTFEYFGADTQQVIAKNFDHLLLTGNGSTKQTLANVNILNSVAVADGVRFKVVSSKTMTLEKIAGRITQEDGLISGRVTKSVDFNTPSDSSDFGGIGLSVRSHGSTLGTTGIVRLSDSSKTSSNGKKSIKRWYQINPADTNGLNGTMYFRYAKDELAGQDSLSLDIWRSPDAGATWRRQHTVRNSGHTLVRTGNYLQGMWTAADVNNLLGRANYEFDPDSMSRVTAKNDTGKTHQIRTVMARVTDVYGNPIENATVNFVIATQPVGASGTSLMPSATTDSLGNVSTQLTIGSKRGTYIVIAQVVSVPTAIDTFYVEASGITLLSVVTNNQSDSIKTTSNFNVLTLDDGGFAAPGTKVSLKIVGAPTNAVGQQVIDTIVTTDVNGQASTRIRRGSKVGAYIVQVSSTEADSTKSFTFTATHGFAALAWKDTLIRQDTIGRMMPQFTYAVTDGDTNAVPNRTVRFALMRPDSSIADSTFVTTDSLGQAKANFSYGNFAGTYIVSAQDINLAGSERFYICTAVRGLARMLAQYSGDAQIGQIGDRLRPFVVQVTDAGGNLVPNTVVNFSIVSRTDMLTKLDSLTAYLDTTDAFGRASTSLTLGNRPGRYTVRASIAGAKDTSFIAYAIMLYADVNNDNYRNIADLTAIIDHVIGRKILTGYNFNKADMYPRSSNGTTGDALIDIRDVQVCLDSLLTAGWDPTRDWLTTPMSPLFKGEGVASLAGVSAPISISLTDSCYVQTTYIGSRFLLKNTIPVKGLQVIIYLKNPVALDTTDLIFPRAKMMTANVKSVGKEVSIILWNYTNTPIGPVQEGDTAIFRLPVQLTNSNVDSMKVIVSTGVNNDVSMIGSKQTDIRNMIPRNWMLYQNYPNPFNPSTTIEFDVPEIAGKIPRVAVQIFNILGQKVTTIERGIHDAGRYSIRWDGMSENGARVASGVYFYRLLAGDYTSTKKMVLMK